MKIYKNQFKREDIFLCDHSSHKDFKKRVSVYHVLMNKQCYPYGCVEFKYKCKMKNKCPRSYKKVNEGCENCQFLIEEKISHIPQIPDKNKYVQFQEELEEFNRWIGKKNGKIIEFWGKINSIKPLFEKYIFNKKGKICHKGFIVSFTGGYIDKDFLDDYLYLILYKNKYNILKLSEGNELEFKARLSLNSGRIILKNPRNITISNKQYRDARKNEEISIPFISGRTFEIQLEKCFICKKGFLIDVIDEDLKKRYKRIFCSMGIAEPEDCYYFAKVQNNKNKEK